MKKQILLATLAAISISAMSALAMEGWLNDVDAGMNAGKTSHKYILVDIYTSWCGWCKKLDRDTFTDMGLAEYLNQKFVCVKANAEDHGSGEKLASKYQVDGYPCALVFDSQGKLIGRISGYKDATGYQSALQNIIANPL
jgi:thioredoxin-related protein